MKKFVVVVVLLGCSAGHARAQQAISARYGIGLSNPDPPALSLNAMLAVDVDTPVKGVGVRAEALFQVDAGNQEYGLASVTLAPWNNTVRPYLLVSSGFAFGNGAEFAFGFGMGAEVEEGPLPAFVEFRGFLEPGIQDYAVAVVGIRF